MASNYELDPVQILRSAVSILLVDWPDQRVPRTLLSAGFTVFGYSPAAYSAAAIVADFQDGQKGFSPRNENEKGYLVFNKLDGSPGTVDIVCVYRPEEEHAQIIEKHVLQTGAKVLWLQPPVTSVMSSEIAAEKGIVFMEGVDIAEIAPKI
jgi:hypothetical protein